MANPILLVVPQEPVKVMVSAILAEPVELGEPGQVPDLWDLQDH